MTQPNFKLYVDSRFLSPYAMSAFVTLTEKGVPFEMQTVNLIDQEHQRPDYVGLSLTARVPALRHGDFYLSESSAISEYLEDVLPPPQYPPVYPSDLQARARARQIQAWLRSDLMPIREERSTEVIFLQPATQPLSAAAKISADRLFAVADSLLADNSLNLFQNWCIADTDLALMLNRLICNGDDVPAKLVAYAQHHWQRPSVQEWMSMARPWAG